MEVYIDDGTKSMNSSGFNDILSGYACLCQIWPLVSDDLKPSLLDDLTPNV